MIDRGKYILTLFILFLMLGSEEALSQSNINDSSVFTPVIAPTYAAFWPSGDMDERYGFTNAIGLSANVKTKGNWVYGVEGYYLFGKQVKILNTFEELITTNKRIRNTSGRYADLLFLERGWHVNLSVGKVFPLFGPNPNSGILFKLGVGGLMHKIYIESRNDFVPQIQGEYKKGYDHLTVGVSTTQFLGYLFQSDNRFLSFYGGFEITEGFTQGIRDYNFNTRQPGDKGRIDILYGFKVGWLVPIYKRAGNEFHYR